MPIKDLKGQRFGNLTVIQLNGRNKHKKAVWECICDCGNHTNVVGTNLTSGGTKGCGCLTGGKTHGLSRTPEYNSYTAMMARCLNPKNSSYESYGGRGITICDRWLESPKNFIEDVGHKPGPEFSLDRIDVDGNYEPNNVRWATTEQQNANQRPFLTVYEIVLEMLPKLSPEEVQNLQDNLDLLLQAGDNSP